MKSWEFLQLFYSLNFKVSHPESSATKSDFYMQHSIEHRNMGLHPQN